MSKFGTRRENVPISKTLAQLCFEVDWSNQLGLSFSPTGRIVHSLSASVEQARSCLMQAPRIYDAFGTFGEAMGPETPEEDSLQTPSGLLIELAELKLCVKLSEQIFR